MFEEKFGLLPLKRVEQRVCPLKREEGVSGTLAHEPQLIFLTVFLFLSGGWGAWCHPWSTGLNTEQVTSSSSAGNPFIHSLNIFTFIHCYFKLFLSNGGRGGALLSLEHCSFPWMPLAVCFGSFSCVCVCVCVGLLVNRRLRAVF